MKNLQVSFKFDGDRDTFEKTFEDAVQPIADTAGLRWKIWLWNEEERVGAGVYLFDDQASIDAYLGGPIIAPLGDHPAISEISVKVYDIVERPTVTTRGPIGKKVSV